ncbi:MAG: ImmA/IrrE family metallo-endopeptidase [Desulfovibrionaceae bacterium]|nr:ImmA/IrrE family metallo-endopeptidase [Desulfovibrionaceae bacterium]
MTPVDAANQVLGQFWDLCLPVDPIAIAGGLGIKVYYSNDLKELSGFYDDEEKEILIHPNESSQRQRFSIAHELGHCVLGHGTSPRKKHSPAEFKERAANIFAASLLMPAITVRTLVEQRGMMFSELCRTFDVSEQAMAIRLSELGII